MDDKEFVEYLIEEKKKWIAEKVMLAKLGLLNPKRKNQQPTELDERIKESVNFIQQKPPICKGCPFIKYGVEDEQRYLLMVKTKVNILLLLFCPKENLPFVMKEDDFYPEYKKAVAIVCPNLECAECKYFDCDDDEK
jgi:hypothetical protein